MLISAASYKIEADSFCVYVIKRLVLSIVIIDKWKYIINKEVYAWFYSAYFFFHFILTLKTK